MAITQSALAHAVARDFLRAAPPEVGIKRVWAWSQHGYIDPERDYVELTILAAPATEDALDIASAALQRMISCLTREILRVSGSYRNPEGTIDVVLAGGRPVPLRGPQHIQVRIRLRLRLVQDASGRGSWDAETAAYDYRLSTEDDREILAYHWHPDGPSPVLSPHLHLGTAAEVGHAALLAAHLPTGQVPIQDVLTLAIESFEVQPQRRDWPVVLGPIIGTPVPPPDR